MNKTLMVSPWILIATVGFVLGAGYFVAQHATSYVAWLLYVVFVAGTTFLVLARQSLWISAFLVGLYVTAGWLTVYVSQHLAILFVVICLLAPERLGKCLAVGWMLACVAAVVAVELGRTAGGSSIQDAIMNGFLTLFIGGFAWVRKESEVAKLQALELTHELQRKNKQLEVLSVEREGRLRMEERQHLSRELHDTLGHKLTTAIVQLEAAERFLQRDPERVSGILQTTRTLMKDGLTETRDIVSLLDSHPEGKATLAHAIENIAIQFEQSTGLSVTLDLTCSSAKQVPPEVQQHFVRIVQEALTNVARHANASRVDVRLQVAAHVMLAVTDNGLTLQGRDGEHLTPARSIASRVAELGGQVAMVREADFTQLTITVPLSAQEGK